MDFWSAVNEANFVLQAVLPAQGCAAGVLADDSEEAAFFDLMDLEERTDWALSL
jgi:hypothetical protein